MRKAIFFLGVLASASLNAQIHFNNPSFEDKPCFGPCFPHDWTYCESLVGILNPDSTQFYGILSPGSVADGNSYVGIENETAGHQIGSIAQKLQCYLRKENLYYFSVSSTSILTCSGGNCLNGLGYFKCYLGNDSCNKAQLIYRSPVLDTFWTRNNVFFKPDHDYQFISFWAEKDSAIPAVDIGLDALSPIYIINAHEVQAAVRDTVLRIKPGEVPCVNLIANTAVTQYDSAAWFTITKNGLQPYSSGLTAQVCTDSNRVFLVALRDTAPNCAGPMWSYDTMRIWVRDTVLGISTEAANENTYTLFPDPAHTTLTVSPNFETPYQYTITDQLGRLCITGTGRKDKLLDIALLSPGAYLLNLNGVVKRFLKE